MFIYYNEAIGHAKRETQKSVLTSHRFEAFINI